MSWLRIGDTASMHPVVLRSLELPNATESLKLELFGFVAMAATMCAAHEGDSIIELGTIFQVAGVARGKQLAAAAEYCGYFEQIQNQQTGAIAYKLIEDPELIHMVSKEQREWANQQRNDTRDSKLVVPIRERDGDACRWCGHVVYWNDKRGARGGTYDHLHPGVAAKSPDDMVVSCRGCNSSRKDSQNSDNDLSQLLPAPQNPWYSDATANFLNEHANLMRTHNHVLPSAKKDKPRGKPKAPPPGSSEPPGSSASTAPPPAWVAIEENQIDMFMADIESSVGERVDAPGAGAPVERPIDPANDAVDAPETKLVSVERPAEMVGERVDAPGAGAPVERPIDPANDAVDAPETKLVSVERPAEMVGERVDAPGAGAPVERPIDPAESEGQSLNTVDLANTGKFLQKATPTDLVTPGRVGSVRVGDPAQAGAPVPSANLPLNAVDLANTGKFLQKATPTDLVTPGRVGSVRVGDPAQAGAPVPSANLPLNAVDLANTGKFLQKATPTDLVTPGRVGSVRVGDPAQAGNLCTKEKSTVRRKRGKRCRKKG